MVHHVYSADNFQPTAHEPEALLQQEEGDENKVFNKDLILRIVSWWLATVPVAIVFAMFSTWVTIKLTTDSHPHYIEG